MFEIPKPIHRSRVRQLLGREYHIARRKANWLFGSRQWASTRDVLAASHRKFSHQSLILRPLRDVDMVLQYNKRRNLELALVQLDRILIHPGETMSVWKLVGRPTRRKGYLEGLVLNQGRISRGTGAGLCQLGNLLFWMAAHSPLTISERWRHGFDVFPDVNRTIPFGAGATLAYNYVDLQITNNTPYCFAIHLWLDDSICRVNSAVMRITTASTASRSVITGSSSRSGAAIRGTISSIRSAQHPMVVRRNSYWWKITRS